MRQTYDRLIGPLAIQEPEPDRSLTALGATAMAILRPVELGQWKVVAGRRPTGELRRQLAEHAEGTDRSVTHVAARLGLSIGGGPAVTKKRAAQLVRAIRDGLAAHPEMRLQDPLVIYPPGEDRRVLRKTHVAPDFMERDRSNYAADAIVWCLRALARREEFVEWERRSKAVSRKWQPSEGVGRLYRLAATEIRRKPALPAEGWIPVFAFALLRASTRRTDARALWHAFVAVGPLLLAMAYAGGPQPTAKPSVRVLSETPERWSHVAAEANAWVAALDELSILEEETEWSEQHPEADESDDLFGGVRAATAALHDSLLAYDVYLYDRVDHLEASDTEGIRAALEDVVGERLAQAGVDAGTPPGTIIGLEAAMLLSVRAVFAGGTCMVCGRRTRGRRTRCREHQRTIWAERQRTHRRRRARPVSATRTRASRILGRPRR